MIGRLGVRTVQTIAVVLLGIVAVVAVAAIAYDVLVHDDPTARTTLGLIGTTSIGGLLVAVGAKHPDPGE